MKSRTYRSSHRPSGDDICTLFANYVPRSEHPDWRALHTEARELAETLRNHLEPPVPIWLDHRRRMRSYATTVRNYLANRRLARIGRQDLWPLYFIWTTHRLCNFRCSYCDDHRGNRYPDLPNVGALDTTQSIRLLGIMRTRVPSALLAGGEPTLRKDLPLITRAARDLSYYPIIIDTNASLIHELLQKPAWYAWLADIDHLVVSLDALDPAVLSRMWSYERPLEVVRNILLLRELAREMRFKLMISTVIQPDSIHHARDVLNLSNDLGMCFCPMPMNVGPTIQQSLLEDPDYLNLVDLIGVRKQAGYPIAGSERMNRRMLTSQLLQCRNTLKPHIDFDGRLFWPCKASVTVDPVMVNTLDYEDVDSLYQHASNLIDPADFQQRCGARCNWSQHYTTDAYVEGLHDPWYLISEIRSFLRAV